jgi:hypothetical protein
MLKIQLLSQVPRHAPRTIKIARIFGRNRKVFIEKGLWMKFFFFSGIILLQQSFVLIVIFPSANEGFLASVNVSVAKGLNVD